jgi:glycosyltransferase involved in cell wall biosynthesis
MGALRRGQKPKPFPCLDYNSQQDIECLCTLTADEITTPSSDLGIKLIEAWNLPLERVVHLSNPYVPVSELLEIPVKNYTNIVTFLGRLEVRKGILEFAQAIPLILHQFPMIRFRFVGAPHPSPQPGIDMQKYLEKLLRRYRGSLEFTGSIAPTKIPSILANTDICVFPSRWENFPNVCLEAMAAARGVVGSSAGGMTEMLANGLAGRLVPPNSPEAVAESVIELIRWPELRMQLGQNARDRVLSEYNQERIGTLQEESYCRAIARRKSLGSRVGVSHSAS